MPDVHSWRQLPQDADDALEALACAHYGAPALATAGSQAVIQALPRLRENASRVGVLAPTYAEHAQHWRAAGHSLIALRPVQIDAALANLDVLVLCNPNNPDAHRIPRAQLLDWHARLCARGGWLVVDEAFADADDRESIADCAQRRGLIVLRSLGKFFGLAGARVGFALCADALRDALRDALGPWCVAGPARRVAEHALRDAAWHARQRHRLHASSARLRGMLTRHGCAPQGGCALFQYLRRTHAPACAGALAAQGILVRAFDEGLRLGLPRTEPDWARLDTALHALREITA